MQKIKKQNRKTEAPCILLKRPINTEKNIFALGESGGGKGFYYTPKNNSGTE